MEKVKSYTERFKEMEDQVVTLTGLYLDASQAFEATANIVKEMSTQIRMLNDQIQSFYDLKLVTREKVTEVINNKRVDRIRNLLDNDTKTGVIKKIDTVSTDQDIVVYTSEDISLAFKAVNAFKEEGLTEKLLGKKAGDTLEYKVGDQTEVITVDSIYQIVQTAQGSNDEQAK